MIEFLKNLGLKQNILSGIVVAVALVPEAVAFSIIAEVSPMVGLYTAFILGLITAIVGGKAGMISGATAAVAVVLVSLGTKVKEYMPEGIEDSASYVLQYILVATILAGIFQLIIGLLKLGKFIRLVPQPAMYGFVNGLAIVIAMAQFVHFEGEGWMMYALVALTMAIIYFVPKITNAVPSGLIAIVVITSLVLIFDLDTKQVLDLKDLNGNSIDIAGSFPTFAFPSIEFSWDMIMVILPYSVLVALVGLIESLLTLSVLDEMGGQRGHGNKECIAQGVGNISCGFFGGMAGCAMIGQSIINFTNGGRGRLSGITAAVLIILFVVALSDYIALIPMAVLIGIMFMVSIGTFEWESAHRLKNMPNSDKFVMFLVTIVTVVEDLAVAVIAGIIISALVFAWKHAKVYAITSYEGDDTKVYTFDGPLFFASTASFLEQFHINHDPKNIILDFKNSRVMDISGVEAIDSITKKYRESGRSLTIRHLSEECIKILKNAGKFCEYNTDDPKYKIAID